MAKNPRRPRLAGDFLIANKRLTLKKNYANYRY